MRDDIHKSAPVANAWRQLIKHCSREADRKERAQQTVEKAVLLDCAREFSAESIKDLMDRCSSPKKDLFQTNLEGVRPAEAKGGVLQQKVIERVKLCEQTNGGTVNLRDQIAGVIDDHKESMSRALRGHVLKAGGEGSGECIEAIRNSINQVSSGKIADDILANAGKVVLPPKKPKTVSLDENLLGGS
jgi:hypothetical protein